MLTRRLSPLTALALLVALGSPRALRAQEPGIQHIVINEVAPVGQPDHAVELYNYGPDQVMLGWTLAVRTSADASTYTFNFPAAFTLKRHALVTLHFTPGSNTASDLFGGPSIPAFGVNGEAVLKDNGSKGIDYVRWGTIGPTLLPTDLSWPAGASVSWGNTTCSLYRQRDTQTRTASDWIVDCLGGLTTFGQLAKNQTGTRRYSPILINEVDRTNPGVSPPRVELFNPNSFAVDIGSWRVRGQTGVTPCETVTLGSPNVINPGAYQTVVFVTTGCNWSGNTAGSVSLLDPASGSTQAWDAVSFGAAPLPQFNPNNFLARKTDMQSGSNLDWGSQPGGSFGAVNPGQLGGSHTYEELGGIESPARTVNTGAPGGIGNRIRITRAVTLREIKFRANVGSAGVQMQAGVYQLTNPSPETWTLIQTVTLSTSVLTEQTYSTGALNPGIRLSSPGEYAVMLFANGAMTVQETLSAERLSPGLASGVTGVAGYPAPTGSGISFGATDTTVAMAMQLMVDVSPAVNPEVSVLDKEAGSSISPVFNSPGVSLAWSQTGTLPASVTFQVATATLVGTPGDADVGSYPNIKIRATDTGNGGIFDENTYTLTIHPRLQWVTASLPSGEQGVGYYPPGASLSASGGPPSGYQWSVVSGSLPSGLALNSGASRIEGTPSVSGTFPVTLRVTDGLGVTADRPFSLIVYPPLNITTVSLPAINQGGLYNQTLGVTGGDAASRSWSIISGALPGGLSLSAAGQITGTAGGPPGTSNFTARVMDATGGSASRALSITVNGPLSIVTPSLSDGDVGIAYSRTLTASGGDGAYNWTAQSGLPAFCSFSTAGQLNCPVPSQAAVALLVRVTDGTSAFVEKTFNFNFVPQPSVASPPTLATGEVGLPYSQNFTAADGVTPYNWGASGLPPGLTMLTGGSITGTPTTPGIYSVDVTVTDSAGGQGSRNYPSLQVVDHVQIDTLGVPDAEVGVPYIASLSASLGQPPYGYTVTLGSLPPGVALSGADLVGTPSATGNYNFTVRVTDALGATFDRPFTINTVPAVDLLAGNPPDGEVGLPYLHSFSVAAGSGAPPFNFSTVTGGVPGLTLGGSGQLSGTPTVAGNHALTVLVTDGPGGSSSRGYLVNIRDAVGIGTPPVLPPGEQGVAYNLPFSATGGAAPFSWSVTIGSPPPGLGLGSTGLLSGTPSATGPFSFTIQVVDALGGVASQGFSLDILPPVTVTTTGPLPFAEATVPYNGGAGVQMTATDGAPPYAWSISAGALPAGMSLDAGGLLSGTPAASGLFGFTVRVQDAAGGFATRAFILTVNPGPTIINTTLPKGVVQVNYPTIGLIVEGGTPPFTYALTSGTLPAGVTFNAANGQFGGKPTQRENQTLQFQVTDAQGATHQRTLSIQVIDPPLPDDWSKRGNFSGGVGQIVLPRNYNGATLPVAFASADGGGELFRSVDRGLSWQPFLIDPNNAGTPIHTLRLSPDFNYAGNVFSGEVYVSTGAGGVYRSSDGGATFTEQNFGLPGASTLDGPRTSALAIHPDYPANKTVWVALVDATTTKLYTSNRTGANELWTLVASFPTAGELGVTQIEPSPNYAADTTLFAVYDGKLYRSSDGGLNFSQIINPAGAGERIRRVVVLPTLAGPVGVFAESNTRGLYRSLDGGNSFITEAIPGHDFAACGTGSGRSLYVKVPAVGGGEYALAKSQDFGKTWVPVYARGMRPKGEIFGSSLAAGGNGGCDLYSGTQAGMTVSTDDGNIFFPRQTGIATIKANSISGKGNFVVAGTDGGFLRSKDGGQTFIQTQNLVLTDNSVIKLPNITLVAVSPSYETDKVFFVSLISNFGSQISSLFRTTDGGFTFQQVLYMNVNSIAFKPGFNGDSGPVMTMYAGTNAGVFVSMDGGLTFAAMPGPSSLLCNASTRKETDGFSLSPRGILPPRLYRSGDGGICHSDDDGASWTMMLGGGGAPFRGTISSPPTDVTSSNGEDRLLLRTDFITYQIYSSVDNGGNWSCVLQPSGPGCLNGIVYARAFFSPNYATDRTALIAVNRSFGTPGGLYRYDAASNRAFPLTSYGSSDQLRGRVITGIYMTPGFNGGNTVNSVALVTTEGGGLYRSTDGGRSFQPVTQYDYASVKVNGLARADGGSLGLRGGGKSFVGPRLPTATGDGTLLMAADDGIYASDDGGLTFDDISLGLPDDVAVKAVASPSLNTAAPLGAVSGNGLYQFTGNSWVQVTDLDAETGNFVNFTEDDTYLYAIRADGVSLRADKYGTNWTALDGGETDLAMASYSNLTGPTMGEPATKRSGPRLPSSTTASLWSVSTGSGPRYSTTSGASWTATPGGNDYPLPSTSSYHVVQALGINSVTGAREVVTGYNGGLYRSLDGGDTWRQVDGSGSGLELTSKNFTAVLTASTAYSTTDVLVGVSGTTNGGVYLSGDGGEHWTVISNGFDPNNQSISSMVKTSCTGCPVQYYSGSYGSGVYTRTVTVNAPPAITSACFTGTSCTCSASSADWTGSIYGAQGFKLCGSGFLTGAVVEFDGVAATGCTRVDANTVTCTGTPAHVAGSARLRIRNSDTRAGYLSSTFTYTGSDSASRASGTLTVGKSGNDAIVSWTCATCSASQPARLHRAQNAAMTLYPEIYNGGTAGTQTGCTAEGGNDSCYKNTSALASTAQNTYFWKVE